jgi:Flp pilus assembly protein TadB
VDDPSDKPGDIVDVIIPEKPVNPVEDENPNASDSSKRPSSNRTRDSVHADTENSGGESVIQTVADTIVHAVENTMATLLDSEKDGIITSVLSMSELVTSGKTVITRKAILIFSLSIIAIATVLWTFFPFIINRRDNDDRSDE